MLPLRSCTAADGSEKALGVEVVAPIVLTVLMMPVAKFTVRIRLLVESAISKVDWEDERESCVGKFNLASIAGPPSPEYPASPFPANEEMVSVCRLTSSTVEESVSDIYMMPREDTATP